MIAANNPAHRPTLEDVTIEEMELVFEAWLDLFEACKMLSKEDQFTVKHLAYSIISQRTCSALKDEGNIPALFKVEAFKSEIKRKALQRYLEVFPPCNTPKAEPNAMPQSLEEGKEIAGENSTGRANP
jgi:hypothetical protein